MSDFSVVSVDKENVEELGFFCVKNKKHVGYIAKFRWLQHRLDEGLRIKLLITEAGKQAGFLEYIPGEYTWRVVHAPDYLVIHCIWVNSNQFPFKGMASALLQDCIQDAEACGKVGVAVVTSDGPWMANKAVFIKNGFEQIDESPPHFQLLVKRTGAGPLPEFPQNWAERLSQFQDLQLIYTNQCPYIGKAVAELPPLPGATSGGSPNQCNALQEHPTEGVEASANRRQLTPAAADRASPRKPGPQMEPGLAKSVSGLLKPPDG
jgi:L-amino acid N-acyltransferase YncA